MKSICKRIYLLCLLAITSIHSFSQHMNYGNNAQAGHYYNINGIRLYCEQYGVGEPLVLLHGNGGNIGAFDKNIAFFSKKFRVIAIDSRAQGKSVDTGDSLSFEMMADDVAALLDTLQIPSAYVVGWSDGGIVALVLAMKHPGKVKKLAATGANIFVDSTAFTKESYNDMMRGYNENKDSVFPTQQRRNDWKVFLLDVFQPNYSFSDLHAVRCPSLIIAGDNDVISLQHTIDIYRHIPDAHLWIVPNSGHATLQEHAGEFNRVVSDFFLNKQKGAEK